MTMERHQADEWNRSLDQLANEGWCSFPAWKLRVWFDKKRLTKEQWPKIIDRAERKLAADGSKILALYNDEKSSHVVFVRTNSFKVFAGSDAAVAVEQIRAWISEIE